MKFDTALNPQHKYRKIPRNCGTEGGINQISAATVMVSA